MLGDFVPLGPGEPKRRETTAGGREKAQWGEQTWGGCSNKGAEEDENEDKKDVKLEHKPVPETRVVTEQQEEEEQEEEEKHVDRQQRTRGRRRRREARDKEEEEEGWTGGVEVRGMRVEFPAGAIDAPQFGVENFWLEVAPHHTCARGTQFVESNGTQSPCDPLTVYPTRMIPARIEHRAAEGEEDASTVVLLFEQGWRVNARRVELTLMYSQHPYTAKLLDCAVLDLAPARAASVEDEHYPADAAARYAGQQRLRYALTSPLPARLCSSVPGTVVLRLAARPIADWRALADPEAPVPVPYETPDDL